MVKASRSLGPRLSMIPFGSESDAGDQPAEKHPNDLHIVCISVDWQKKTIARCPGLTQEQLTALAEAAETWRDPKYRHARMLRVGTELGLGRLVFLYDNPKQPLRERHVPPPFPVSFEPVELSELDRRLADLVDLVTEHSPSIRAKLKTSRIRRWFLRSGLPIALYVNLLGQVVGHLTIQGGITTANLIVVVPLVGAIIAYHVYRLLRLGQWYLIPGGAFERRGAIGPANFKPRRFTPADTVLVIEWVQHGWNATFLRKGETAVRGVTRMELVGLLAAWQSPVEPPSEETLRSILS